MAEYSRGRFKDIQGYGTLRARVPDAVQRDSGAPLIRDPGFLLHNESKLGLGSAAHHIAALVLRCARDTRLRPPVSSSARQPACPRRAIHA